ncbi:hypothetical protein [Candidatus Magnetobacterium casense]|uniref:Uncharacterized protein n=1 Tax=Candidatus Magnetobacterium casense TaxID=1455061 RepID=A0ABS6S4L4_9BACT|nr:hypothetical protein [Candidatus Magnetobacterium casensis]MBV6343313.1 hypothetical protein [Candidatus Magnetobacterium casensis]
MAQVLSTIRKNEEPPPERVLGNFWSQKFADMMNRWYGVHKFDKAPSPIITLPNGMRIILADVLLLEKEGENYYCEVKHKAPTKFGSYGLEEYRFNSLKRLQEYVRAKVLYVIHDHSLNGGRDNPYNDINHWKVATIPVLVDSPHIRHPGPSLVNGVRQIGVPIYYWATTLWIPVNNFFQLERSGHG